MSTSETLPMSKAILFDTNVLVYAKDQPSSFHDTAVQFLDNNEGEIYTISKNLSLLAQP
ncbi:putative nucleic acid-binding protein [Catalinimonas alkaloidigena]|nr:putative nucleic acid-binding protein [Catalinimonas alkaloidigena]